MTPLQLGGGEKIVGIAGIIGIRRVECVVCAARTNRRRTDE